jgi:Cd2+/Zn2+-exporting ATPase
VHSELLPQDKLALLQRYRQRCTAVAHVGDGINDAPALANADVGSGAASPRRLPFAAPGLPGSAAPAHPPAHLNSRRCAQVGIAMGVAGSALAIEAADVALFSNDLRNLPFAVELSRRVAWVVAFNIVFAISVKAAVLALAFSGHITLWISVLADVGSALLVTLHGLTVLRFQAGRAPQRQQLAAECVGRRGLAAAGGCCEGGACGAAAAGAGCCDGGGQAQQQHGHSSCCGEKASGGQDEQHQHGSGGCGSKGGCSDKGCGVGKHQHGGGHGHQGRAAEEASTGAASSHGHQHQCSHQDGAAEEEGHQHACSHQAAAAPSKACCHKHHH